MNQPFDGWTRTTLAWGGFFDQNKKKKKRLVKCAAKPLAELVGTEKEFESNRSGRNQFGNARRHCGPLAAALHPHVLGFTEFFFVFFLPIRQQRPMKDVD